MLKIYPTLVIPGTGLYEDWKAGRYLPYETDVAATLLARIKRELPPWVRIQRIQRDIPARLIAAGVPNEQSPPGRARKAKGDGWPMSLPAMSRGGPTS